MQNTSALWKRLWAGGEARLECVAVIGGTTYGVVGSPVINRALMQGGLSVGNAVSATCRLTLRTEDAIAKSAQVAVKMRLTDGTEASEWLEAGTFFVSHRARDAVTGLLTLECYDAMLKGNAEYDADGQWPRSMGQVVSEIAGALGVAQDSRNVIRAGDDWRVLLPEAGATLREVLGGIASAHGGNWVITPQNRLRLVPLDATGDAAEVRAVFGGVNAGTAQSVTGLRVTGVGDERLIGSESGLVVEIDSPYATEGSLSWLSGRLIGLHHQPYELKGAVYDPAAELGDAVASRSDVASMLACEAVTLGPAFRGDLSAPEAGDMADEYPYIGTPDKVKRLQSEVRELAESKADTADVAAAEARANAVTQALEQSLDQQEIFNRLTNDGQTQGIYLKNGKLYINGTYLDTGMLNANLLKAGVISDATGQNYWILAGNDSAFVTKKGTIGAFTLDGGSLSYGSLAVNNTGAYIGGDGIIFNEKLSSNTMKVRMKGQGLYFYQDDVLRARLNMQSGAFYVCCYDEKGVLSFPFQITDTTSTKASYLRYNTYCEGKLQATGELRAATTCYVAGSLTVAGTKSRKAATGQYGDRVLYCYETPSPMFGDVGEGVIGEDGRCHVWLDAIFADTITTTQYQVFLQKYGAGDCCVAERKGGCFIVEGTPGLAFGWEIKAKQRDFDQRRLERYEEPVDMAGDDYGDLAAQYIENLKNGRISA